MFDDPALEAYEEYLIQKHLYPKKSKFPIDIKKLIAGIFFIICLYIIYFSNIPTDNLSIFVGMLLYICFNKLL